MPPVGPGSATRWVVVPGTAGDLTHTFAMLEEVLLLLQPVADSENALADTGPNAVHALRDIYKRLLAGERKDAPQLYAPDEKFEYLPLFFFQLLEA